MTDEQWLAQRKAKVAEARRAPARPEYYPSEAKLRKWARGKRQTFIVTAAQNNTPVHTPFLRALVTYADALGATLIAQPVRYRNPHSHTDPNEDRNPRDYWWDPALEPYLVDGRVDLGPETVLLGAKVPVTSPNPLSPTIHGMTQGKNGLVAHPELAMCTVPTPQNRLASILYSTGAVTCPNYADNITAQKASFHHSFAAVIVEVRGRRTFLRELVWDKLGGFTDFDTLVTPDGVYLADPAKALIVGDTHVGSHDPAVHRALWGKGGVVERLRPEVRVLHDLFDASSCNPHERDNPHALYHRRDRLNVQRELEEVRCWLEDTDRAGTDTVVVASNHDDMLDRWLKGPQRYVLPENLQIWHYLNFLVLSERIPALHAYFDDESICVPVRFLRIDESYRVEGIELGMHGHLGPNGSRGSRANLARIGTRSMIGHSHGPGIYKGVYQVGTTSVLDPDYTKGPSGWFHTCAQITARGKRQMIHFVHGRCHG